MDFLNTDNDRDAFVIRFYVQFRGFDRTTRTTPRSAPEQVYYMEESVLLGTKPLVDSIRHFIRDPSGVFSVRHLRECRIVQ